MFFFLCQVLQPLNADTLVLVTLHADQDVSLVQYKHPNLLWVYQLFFG